MDRLIAHEAWFVSGSGGFVYYEKPPLFSSWNSINSSMALFAIFAILAALLIHFAIRRLKWMRRMRSALGSYSNWVSAVLRTFTGAALIIMAVEAMLFAPDLKLEYLGRGAVNILSAVEFFVGFGFVTGIFLRFASLAGIALFITSLFVFPTFAPFAYISYMGIFIYLFIVGDSSLPKVRGAPFKGFKDVLDLAKAKPYAMVLMRYFGGASFIIAAGMYKLFGPQTALEFMRMNDVNFVRALGFVNFSNEMFVLSAGLTEAVIGILIILGLLPRFTGALLIILFTITLGMFGATELIGHLPLYAFAFALLVNGGGKTK